MTTHVVARAPRARCVDCGSTDVHAACHHCGALMCRRDVSPVTTPDGKPLSREFTELGIEAPRAYHCRDCAHVVPRRLWRELLGGAAGAVLGVLLMFASFAVGLVVFLLGAGTAVAAYLVDRARNAEAQRTRPPLPLMPKVDSAKIRETVRGTLSLDADGRYRTTVEPAVGELAVAMTFARADLERLDLYRRKYRLPTGGVDYHAGFAVLRGESGAVFADEAKAGPVIALTGRTDGHPFFAAADGRTGAKWEIRSTYAVSPERDVDHVPIWLTPALAPEQDQRTLEIEVQWSRVGPDDAPLVIDRFEPLVLFVPVHWGNVESANYRPTVGRKQDPDDPERVVRCIEWNQVVLNDTIRSTGRLTLSVRFEERISLADEIRGHATASFRGSLSGLSDIGVLLPLGGRRGEDGTPANRARTRVRASFRLSLAGVRYQDVRVVPDRDKNRDKDVDRPDTEEFPGVIPDHETVARLTDALSDEGYYVKRVIENPARPSGKANVMNRYWDIAGRGYDGVYPIDFHLSLTGEELHNGDIRAQAGNSRVRLIVQAAYASAAMEQQIEGEWDRLSSILRESLKSQPSTTADAYFGGPVGPPGHADPVPRPAPEVSPQVAELERQRAELVRQVAEGTLSEQTFREVSTWIDRQLGRN